MLFAPLISVSLILKCNLPACFKMKRKWNRIFSITNFVDKQKCIIKNFKVLSMDTLDIQTLENAAVIPDQHYTNGIWETR